MFKFVTFIAMNFWASITFSVCKIIFGKVSKTALFWALLELRIFLNEKKKFMFFYFCHCWLRQFAENLFFFIQWLITSLLKTLCSGKIISLRIYVQDWAIFTEKMFTIWDLIKFIKLIHAHNALFAISWESFIKLSFYWQFY